MCLNKLSNPSRFNIIDQFYHLLIINLITSSLTVPWEVYQHVLKADIFIYVVSNFNWFSVNSTKN